MTVIRPHIMLSAVAALLMAPTAVGAQVTSSVSTQPTNRWTLRVSSGPANSGADGSQGGPQLQLAVERAIGREWSLRVENRTLWTRYDPSANPDPVSSTTELGFGVAMIKEVPGRSPLLHAYLGGGVSFLVTSFDGVPGAHDKAAGVFGVVGAGFHPESRRWSAVIEVFLQFRPMPDELANGYLSVGQIGISFGMAVPILRHR